MTTATRRPPWSPGVAVPARLRSPLVAAGLLALAGWIAVEAHAGRAPDALPDTFRAGVAAVVLFALTGYPAARLATPASMQPHVPLLALPFGAACSSLALTVLGTVAVPFELALALVLAAGVVACVLVQRRPGPEASADDRRRAGGLAARLAWPAFLALLLATLALLPVFREGVVTTIGENPDAHLVTGAAEVVREGPPTATQPELPVDRVSPFWLSKYPIYYSLAAVSSLSGLDPVEALPVLSALLIGLFALGAFLLAFHSLGVGAFAAAVATGLATLDRISLHTVVHPYYNQLWGLFALPFILLFGYRFLREPTRRHAVPLVLFGALGAFAYPLMLPFPAVALGIPALLLLRERSRPGWLSRMRLRRPRGIRWLAIPPIVVVMLVALVLTAAVVQKLWAAAEVVVPWGDLDGWQGDSPHHPLGRYFGLDLPLGLSILGIGLLGAGAVATLGRLPRGERFGLAAMILGAAVMAANFDSRAHGEYFAFKVLAYLGPLVVLLGAAALASATERLAGWRRAAGGAALALLIVVMAAGARNELEGVTLQAPPEAFELRGWAEALPPGATVRLDIPPTGIQLWAAYMLHERPLSAFEPVIGTTYPRVPRGRKADFVLAHVRQPRPPDALGAAVRRNDSFVLYRMDPAVPGADRSSRRRIQP